MFKVFCCAVIVACVALFSQCAKAAELIVSFDRFSYDRKDYAASTAVLTRYGGEPTDIVYPGACTRAPNESRGFTCTPSSEDLTFQDQLKGLVSGVWASSESGFGWYATGGMWQWSTLKPLQLRSDAQLECGVRACWWHVHRDFEVEKRYVAYIGGGLQYRFDWTYFSLVPFIAVVGHWPRIEPVSGTNHLFQSGLRAGVKLSSSIELVVRCSHFSNGRGLGLAGKSKRNQGMETLGLGLSWTF